MEVGGRRRRWHVDVCEGFASGEGVAAEELEGGREGYRGEGFAAVEDAVADGCEGGWKGDGCE